MPEYRRMQLGDLGGIVPRMPPDDKISAAMISVADLLAEAGVSNSPHDLFRVRCGLQEQGHKGNAIDWAIRRHFEAGRIGGKVRIDREYLEEHPATGEPLGVEIEHETFYISATPRMWEWRAAGKGEKRISKVNTPTDGPTLDGFCWQGVLYKGMRPTAWKLVSYLWGRDPHIASFVDLAGEVWDHSVTVGVDRVRSAKREANRFFDSNTILFEINVDGRLNTVELAEIKSS